MGIPTISPEALHRLSEAGRPIELIDVRTPAEHRAVHAKGARCVPLDVLDPKAIVAERTGGKDDPVYMLCRSGARARQACERLIHAGFSNVVLVEGGTLAWERAGLPVTRGVKTISLPCQVQIVAGSLIVLGVALGAFAHPAVLAVPAVVGAGLIYTGVTDDCVMARLLGRLPWNRAADRGGPCSLERASS